MEDKRLNINQPLLSVRRFSSIAASQDNENRETTSYLPTRPSIDYRKAELKLDSFSKTGSIPFVWEHSPGKPKDETITQSQTKESPPSLPKLPPGRILKPKKQDLDSTTENGNAIKGPLTNCSTLRIVLPTEEKPKFDSAKSSKKGSSDSSGGDDNDEEFMDALDTLSRGESSFYNCSAASVSGLGSDMKPSGIPPADRKLRDFMMDRFLPAAKAMTSEVPQYTRKHVVKEKPIVLKKLGNMGDKKPQLRYGPTFLQDVAHDNEDDEDSDYDFDEHGNKSSKFCGLFPRFGTKGSLSLLSPVPAMRNRLPTSPADRTQASFSCISHISKIESEPARIATYEHRPVDRSQLAKQQEDKNVSKNESVETTTNDDSPKLQGSRLYNHLQGHGISSGPNELLQSINSERNDSHSRKKSLTRFKDLLANNKKSETDGQDSIVEKTLYVDTVHVIKSPKENNSLRLSIEGQSSKDTDKPNTSHISYEPVMSVMLSDEPKHDKKTEMYTYSWKDYAALSGSKNDDKNMKASQDGIREVVSPPPLPKSPSDSWLQRRLPSVSPKNTPLQLNPTESESDKNIQFRRSQGSLFPIPET